MRTTANDWGHRLPLADHAWRGRVRGMGSWRRWATGSIASPAGTLRRSYTPPSRMDPPSSFRTTLGAACRGDRGAHDTLFGRNLPVLVAYLRKRIGGATARAESPEDLAQSVCREVLVDLPSLEFHREDQFRAYLFLQARRKLIDRARYYEVAGRDPGRQRDLAAGPDPSTTEPTPSRVAVAKETMLLAEQAMGELPDNQREALLLSRVAGMSYGEIAELKGQTESAIRGLVARALSRLSGLAKRKGLLPQDDIGDPGGP